ncbi:uncharacterized protein LOC106154746 [Lingula anatina]|uniref:Uncharacterized protein LOC106154746 n=1 Tax=Lingula anatina TaxID=7574 RepID=A0A1S3HI42_LINAN|nr:uncharacterized protein LOC106154746 [Lingula anatina]|eukprot:XP_013384659.1 uncharacterized protein LOC106154746 [Lingula anatina]
MFKLVVACALLAVALAQFHPRPFGPRPTGDGPHPPHPPHPHPTGDGPDPSVMPHGHEGHTHPPLDCERILAEDCSKMQHNRPVCGSDDVTYDGMCSFGQAKCKNEDLTVQWFASCEGGMPTRGPDGPFGPHGHHGQPFGY